MVKIFNQDRLVRQSRNLRGLIEHFRREIVERVELFTDGRYAVYFANGDYCSDSFASFRVMVEWFNHRRNLRGVPYSVDGVSNGFCGQ